MGTPPVTIAILVIPDASGSVVYGLYDLLKSAGLEWDIITKGRPGPELIRPLLVARNKGLVEIVNNVPVKAQFGLENCPVVDIVCVPEVSLPPGTPLAGRYAEEIAWLQRRHESGSLLAAACSGAMLFAEAGLLDGWEATTHWAWCDVLRKRFPNVTVHGQRALVASGKGQRLIMAGGGTSWLDLALYLIGRTLGIETAMQVARLNLIDWHQIGQQPFARLACTRQVEDAAIARCQTWIAEHYQEPNPVNSMIRLSGLAERSFKRRFQKATGMSPLKYVHALRLEEAKQMLESTETPIEGIANEVGYEDAGYFSRLFRREVDMTPAHYRKRFGALHRSLTARVNG